MKTLTAVGAVAALLGVTACGEQRSTEAFCDTIEEHAQAIDEEFGDQENPNEFISEALDAVEEMMDDAADVAPEEIQESTEEMADAIAELQASDVDLELLTDPAALMELSEEEAAEMEEEFQELEERFADVDEHGDAVGNYIDENCDISSDLNF